MHAALRSPRAAKEDGNPSSSGTDQGQNNITGKEGGESVLSVWLLGWLEKKMKGEEFDYLTNKDFNALNATLLNSELKQER